MPTVRLREDIATSIQIKSIEAELAQYQVPANIVQSLLTLAWQRLASHGFFMAGDTRSPTVMQFMPRQAPQAPPQPPPVAAQPAFIPQAIAYPPQQPQPGYPSGPFGTPPPAPTPNVHLTMFPAASPGGLTHLPPVQVPVAAPVLQDPATLGNDSMAPGLGPVPQFK